MSRRWGLAAHRCCLFRKFIHLSGVQTSSRRCRGKYFHYRPETKFAKVRFLHVSVCPQGGGCVWQGAHAWQGDLHGRGHVWQGGICGKGSMIGRACMHDMVACMAGGCAWQGVCMAGGVHCRGHVWQGGMAQIPPGRYEIRSMSGRYASYWNAFLLYMRLVLTNESEIYQVRKQRGLHIKQECLSALCHALL